MAALPPSTTTTKKCNAPCPTTQPVCSPACTGKEECILTVISNLCECPVAKCVITNFDGGNDNSGGNNPNGNEKEQGSKKPSILAPVLGSVLGLSIIGLAVFLFLRRRRQRRRTNKTHLLHSSNTEDSLKSPYESSSEMAGHRDVIRIAYIPSMISDSSPIQIPSQAADTDSISPPKASFMALDDSDRNKHDSIASTASTDVLEAAMMTTVTKTKATPQVMRLNTIKRDNNSLIQRSNSLHSNNSIKRTKSQRKLAQARELTKSPLGGPSKKDSSGAAGQPRRSSDSAESTHTDSDDDAVGCDGNDHGSPFRDTRELIEYTPAVMVTGPSARSSVRSTASGTPTGAIGGGGGGAIGGGGGGGFRSPTMVLGPLPIEKQQPSTSSTTSTSTIVISPTHIPGSMTTTSSKDNHNNDDDDDPLSLLDIQGAHHLRPWARQSMASGGTRDSTFSTASDARSSTRGDGEEIMIFWDGHRNSTRSSLQNDF